MNLPTTRQTPELGAAPAKKRASPVLLLAGMLALMFTVLALLDQGGGAGELSDPHGAPALFGEPASCSEPPRSALHRASELERKALAKNERAPWRVQDGIEAALCLDQARACYAAAGETERARAAAALLGRWRRKLESDYQRSRLQLEFALQQAISSHHTGAGVPPAAAHEIADQVADLKQLLAHRAGPYQDWLDQVARAYAPNEEK